MYMEYMYACMYTCIPRYTNLTFVSKRARQRHAATARERERNDSIVHSNKCNCQWPCFCQSTAGSNYYNVHTYYNTTYPHIHIHMHIHFHVGICACIYFHRLQAVACTKQTWEMDICALKACYWHESYRVREEVWLTELPTLEGQ